MNEYDKMISGQIYDARDLQLTAMRKHARVLLDQINRSVQDIRDGERAGLCKQLLGAVGHHLWLQPPFYCDYGQNITLGDNVFINFNCVFLDVAKIAIGDSVQIGPNVQVYTATHPLEWQKRSNGDECGKPIAIGDNVWIGGGAIICPGVTIGKRSVIGAGSIIVKNVPDGVVVAGNPGKILRRL